MANLNTWDSTTGFNDLQQTVSLNTLKSEGFANDYNFSVFPNPAENFITIQCESFDNEKIEIYDVLGQLIKSITVSNNQKIDISNLSKGIYFIILENKVVFKFIKL